MDFCWGGQSAVWKLCKHYVFSCLRDMFARSSLRWFEIFLPFRPQVAVRLLAHKIQSPQEKVALQALTVSNQTNVTACIYLSCFVVLLSADVWIWIWFFNTDKYYNSVLIYFSFSTVILGLCHSIFVDRGHSQKNKCVCCNSVCGGGVNNIRD